MLLNTVAPPVVPLTAQQAQARSSAEDFESMFLFQMLELMTPEPDEKNTFNGGAGEAAFKPQLNEAMAKNMAKNGGIGVADYVYDQIIKYQEIAK